MCEKHSAHNGLHLILCIAQVHHVTPNCTPGHASLKSAGDKFIGKTN